MKRITHFILFFLLFFLTNFYSDLYVTNKTSIGEKIYIFVSDVDEKGSLLNGTIKVTTPSKHRFNVKFIYGQAEINATESGKWIIEYKGIKKNVTVEAGDTQKEKESNSNPNLTNPYLIFLILIFGGVALGGVAILFALHFIMKPWFELNKEYNENKITIKFINNTGETLTDVIIEDKVPEEVSNISILPEKRKKNVVVWRLKKVLPYEEKRITYNAKFNSEMTPATPATASFIYKNEKIILTSQNSQSQIKENRGSVQFPHVFDFGKENKRQKTLRKLKRGNDPKRTK